MRPIARALWLAAAALAAAPLAAQDFSEGSEARSWNLYAEQPARFGARVVDVLCELTGDCPADCGGGTRQMGLVRSVDGVMVLALKNNQPNFMGAAAELAPFCNQTVTVDGLLLDDPDLGAKHVYQVQTILPEGASEPVKADTAAKRLAEANPEATGDGPWFRRDPRINAIIAEEGYLGLGLAEDERYAEENF